MRDAQREDIPEFVVVPWSRRYVDDHVDYGVRPMVQLCNSVVTQGRRGQKCL